MSGKVKLMIVAIAIAAVLILATGITIAVVTSDSSSSGVLNTAHFSLEVKTSNVKAYTAVLASEGDADTFIADGKEYKYVQSSVQSGNVLYFADGGSVTYADTDITIDGIMPGDKVEFDIDVTSKSAIAFNYRAELRVDADQGEKLLNQLDFSAGELSLRRQDLASVKADEKNYKTAVLTDYTEWKTLAANQTNVEKVHISISLPITANDGQGETVKLAYVAYGEQNADEQPDVAEVGVGDNKESFKSLADAVRYANEAGIDEVRVVGNTSLEEGTVIINNGLRITGVSDLQGNNPTLKGARVAFEDSAAATISNVNFAGVSYIDVSKCFALTLDNCSADISATKYFDTITRDYLPNAAFIVSGTSQNKVRLTLNNNRFVSTQGSAVCLRSELQSGSKVVGNTFGSLAKPFDGSAILAFDGVATENSEAIVTVENNVFYGKLAMSLGNGNGAFNVNTAFRVISRNNTAVGATNGMFVGGSANGAFCDYNSKVNGKDVVCANISSNLLYGGVNVQIGANNQITSGTFALNGITWQSFAANYVVAAVDLANNAIGLLNANGLYAYVNGSASGYVLETLN